MSLLTVIIIKCCVYTLILHQQLKSGYKTSLLSVSCTQFYCVEEQHVYRAVRYIRKLGTKDLKLNSLYLTRVLEYCGRGLLIVLFYTDCVYRFTPIIILYKYLVSLVGIGLRDDTSVFEYFTTYDFFSTSQWIKRLFYVIIHNDM